MSDVFKDVAEHASQSHQLSGSLNFPRRIATTYLNEAVWHLQDKLANELKTYMDKLGVNVPLYILKADGGTVSYTHLQEPDCRRFRAFFATALASHAK